MMDELSRIKDLLKTDRRGMNIRQISEKTGINRNVIAQQLGVLAAIEEVEVRVHGRSKVYFLAQQVPLSDLMKFSSNFILSLDQDFRIIQANDAFLRYLNLPKNQVIYAELTDIPTDIFKDPKIMPAVNAALLGTENHCEIGVKTDTHDVWYEITFTPTRFQDLSHGVILVLENITERKEMENALRDSEEKYRRLAEQTYDVLYSLDAQKRITYIGPQVSRIGYKQEDFLFKPFNSFILPEDREAVTREFEKNLSSGEGKTINIFRITDSQGQLIWVESSSMFQRDDTGTVTGIYGVLRDITERKRAENALLENQLLLEEAMDQGRMGYWELDISTKTFTFNDRFYALYGTTAEREGGYRMPWDVYAREFIHPDDRGMVAREIAKDTKILDPVYFSEMEHRIIRRDGGIRHIVVRHRIIRDGKGRLIKTRGVNQDITKRKQAEEELRESEERVRRKLENLLAPEGDIGILELGDILDIQALQQLMEDFTVLTGMVTAILDIKGNVLVATGWQDICTRFHRVNPVTARFCTESDLHLAKKVKQGEYATYRCRNGLQDAVTPLYIGSRLMGSIHIGQCFYDDEIIDEAAFVAQAEKYGFDKEEYLSALRRVPRFSREKIEKLMEYLVKLTGFISLLSYSNLKLARTVTDRDRLLSSLGESEERYRQIFESSPVSLWEEDFSEVKKYLDDLRASGITGFREHFEAHPDSVSHCAGLVRIKEVNKATLDLVGARDKTEVLSGLCRIFTKESLEVFREELVTLADGGLLFESEVVHSTLAGNKISVILHLAVVPGYERSLDRVLISLLDITRRKAAEDALHESEEKYRTILENVQDVFYRSDRSGNLIMLSPSGASLLGYSSPDELIGFSIAGLMYANPDDRVAFLEAMKEKGFVRNYEVSLRRKDGSVMIVSTNSHYYYDSDGSIAGVEGMLHDITERKAAEQQIAESSRFLTTLIDTLPVPVFYKDADGKYLGCNLPFEEYFGISRSELVGKTVYDIFPKDLADNYRTADLEVLDNPALQKYDTQVISADGSRHDVIFYKAPFYNYDGSIGGLIGTFIDITERKAAEDALHESEEKYRTILENIQDVFYRSDLNGKIVILSPSGASLLGYSSPDELVGFSLADQVYTAPDGRAKFLEAMKEKGFVRNYEVSLRRKDGSVVTVSTSSHYYYDRDGSIAGVEGTFREVTERGRA